MRKISTRQLKKHLNYLQKKELKGFRRLEALKTTIALIKRDVDTIKRILKAREEAHNVLTESQGGTI